MLQLFVTSLTLTNAFTILDSVEEAVFAAPPAFGSYSLQKQVDEFPEPLPLINLEETCEFSSNLQDDANIFYAVSGLSEEVLSCTEAFEMHKSMYSSDVCNFAYPLNDDQDTLLNRCGKTFCSECTQVENAIEEPVYGKEVSEDQYVMAPGFEISPAEGKHSFQGMVAPVPVADTGMVAPTPMEALDDATLPSLLVPDVDPVVSPKAMAAPLPNTEVVGIEAPTPMFQDTPVEASLEAPMMPSSSMVPPGITSPKRLNRYQNEL